MFRQLFFFSIENQTEKLVDGEKRISLFEVEFLILIFIEVYFLFGFL